MLNDRLSPKIKYGKWYYTISANTGINYVFKKDNPFRKFLDRTLGKNHCINSITPEQKYFYKIKN